MRFLLLLFAAFLGLFTPVAAADPDPDAGQPGADANAGDLTGAEVAILRNLDHHLYRTRLQASRGLAGLDTDRAIVVITRGLHHSSERVRTACAREAGRRDPLPVLARPLLDLLANEAIDIEGSCFCAARDAFFRLGDDAETAYASACDDGLLTRAPELTDFFQRMAREALPGVIDRVREPTGGVLLMPWSGQFDAVLKPEWIEILEGMVREGAATLNRVGRPAIPFLTDAPPEIRRGALACFALGEWAARRPDAVPVVHQCLRDALAMVGAFRPALHWIRGPREQLPFAIHAVLHRIGDTGPLGGMHRSVTVRLRSLQENHERSEVPRAWFMLRLHQALYSWWMGKVGESATSFADALTESKLTAGSGVDREVIAQAHVLWARVQTAQHKGGNGDITPDTICDTLDQAGEFGLRDVDWLQAISDFAPLRGTSRFRALITRMAVPVEDGEVGDGNDGNDANDGREGD